MREWQQAYPQLPSSQYDPHTDYRERKKKGHYEDSDGTDVSHTLALL